MDLLDKEKGLKQARDQAIEYLDSISSSYDNSTDTEIEKKIMQILSGQEKALEQLDTHVNELKKHKMKLDKNYKLKKKNYKEQKRD